MEYRSALEFGKVMSVGGCCSTVVYGRRLAAAIDFASHLYAPARTQLEVNGSEQGSPVSVLIAADHECLRSSLKTMLELDPSLRVVGEATDDCETIKMAHRLRPDVLLIDLDMRCCDKFEALSEIGRRGLASNIIALSIHNGREERQMARDAGVNTYLEKGVSYKELIRSIRAAAAPTVPA